MNTFSFIQLGTTGSSLLPENSSALDLILYALLGFTVVLGILALLMGVTVLMGLVFRAATALGNGGGNSELAPTADCGGLDEEVVLVVTAAVASMLDRPHRIRSIVEQSR